MLTHLVSKFFSRAFMAVMVLAVLALSLPRPVSAASPSFSIIAVKANEQITIRTQDFPANVNFTIRMDVAGNLAIDGIVVGQTNSGIGGAFEAIYRIPAELKDVQTIAIRFESKEGYYTYNWFNNRTTGAVSTPAPAPIPVTGAKPTLTFTGVKSNAAVTVEARNLPANTTFTVRVGPYYTFFRDYVIVPSVKTDGNGYVKFTITLPDVVKNVQLVTVRLDGGGRYAFNAFKNVDGGIISPTPTTVTPAPVVTTGTCQIVSVTPGSSVLTHADYDVVWTIKNISNKTWDGNSVDYKYVNGTKMQKRGDYFDLHQTIKPGDTVKVTVDMVAPASTGTYYANWALVQGSKTLCNMPLTLSVK